MEEKRDLEKEKKLSELQDDYEDDSSYDDNYYDDGLDEDYEDNLEEDYDDEELEDEEEPKKLGEEQFDKTIEDKDYYKKRNEELQKEYDDAKKEAEKDTMEIPKEGKDEDSSAKDDGNSELDDASKKDTNEELNKNDDLKKDESNDKTAPEDKDDKLEKDKDKESSDAKDNAAEKDKKDEDSKNKNSDDEKHDKSKEESKDNSKNKNDDNREVVAVNKDGSKVVKKNDKDRKNDQRNLKNAQKNLKNNKIDEKLAKAYGLAHPIEAAKKKITSEIKKKAASLLVKIAPYILAGIGIILGCIVLFCLIGGIVSYFVGNEQTGLSGYYNAPCQNITVVGVLNENDGTYSQGGVYSVEDYVAGVLASEVGNANNMEVYKAFAIAIRTYTFRNVDSTCSIENSTRKQTFRETTDENLLQAAKETMGIVLIDEEGSLMSAMYDSCHIYDDNSSLPYITITQKNQTLPRDWYEANKNRFVGGGHGQGMSQCGAYYLGDEGYTYDQILRYYYDNIILKSTFMTTGIAGLEDYTLDSTGTVILRTSLEEFLNNQIPEGFKILNQKIVDNVNAAGYQTRAGVVAAAVTLIGEVGNLGYRIPYFWGGGQGFDGARIGAQSYWGGTTSGNRLCSTNANNIRYDLCGLDCAGFVNWAIYNAGFKVPAYGSNNLRNVGEVVSLKSGEAVVQAGDLLHGPGHIMLVVGVDFNTNEYIIAEAAGYAKGVLFSRRGFGSNLEGVKMDVFYNNEASKR